MTTNDEATCVSPSHVKEGTTLVYESEIPQVEEMTPLNECLDDEGNTLPKHLASRITSGNLMGVYVKYPNGVENFIVPYKALTNEVVSVPRGTTFVRDTRTSEALWGVSAVAGGSGI